MSSMQSMIEKLRPTGLYTITGALNTELSVYALELDRVEEELDTVLQDAFLETAGTSALGELERIFGPVRTGMNIAKRREMLIGRMGLGSSSFTPDEIDKALSSFGLVYVMTEYPRFGRLNIIAAGNYTKAEQNYIIREVTKLCPAHIEVQVVFNTLSWSELDSRSLSFSQLDAMNLTWEQIDSQQ